jgi:polar amino acid transport system permease protein
VRAPWEPRQVTSYDLRLLLDGFLTTVILALLGGLAGFIVGFAAALLRNTDSPAMAPVRAALVVYCLVFRRVPFLVTLMLVFFAGQSMQTNLSNLAVAAISLGLIAAAYLCEITRGGLASVHANQWQAARALNFGYWQTLRYVIVPQAWRVILPPTFAFLVMFIKDTALASQIGVMDLTSAGKVLENKGMSAPLVYGTILMLYFLMSYPLSRFGKRVESRLAVTRHR